MVANDKRGGGSWQQFATHVNHASVHMDLHPWACIHAEEDIQTRYRNKIKFMPLLVILGGSASKCSPGSVRSIPDVPRLMPILQLA